MRSLTLNEIARTAFPQLPERDGKDSNHICPYCKNQSTDTVRDTAYRGPFKAFYKLRPFTVYHCYCCTAVWSTAPPHAAHLPIPHTEALVDGTHQNLRGASKHV